MLKSLFTIHISTERIGMRFVGRLSEWHMASVMLLAGLVYLFNGRTFALDVYTYVRQVADQPTWAMIMLLIGVARLVVLVVNGAMPRGSPHLRSILSSLSAIVWAVLLTGFIAYGTALLIDVFLFMAVIVELISAYRAAQEARLEDDDRSGAGHDATG